VIVFTVYASAHYRQKALEAGADAFIFKGTDLRALLDLFDQFALRWNGPPGAITGA